MTRIIEVADEYVSRSGSPKKTLLNMYAEPTPQGPRKFSLRPRPCLVRAPAPQDVALGTGPVHFIRQVGISAYVLSGDRMYRDGVLLAGPVATGGFQQSAQSEDQFVVLSGYNLYLVSTTATTQIADPDLPDIVSVVFAGGYFLYAARDSGTIYYSEPNDATNVSALNFFSAETAADPNARLEVLNDEVVAFGSETIEFFGPTGNVDQPFRRSAGRTQDKGCVAAHSVVKVDNGIFFAGQDGGAGRAIYRTDGGIPQKVSTPTIDDHLLSAGINILSATAYQVLREGHSFYVINVPTQGTYAYDVATQRWAVWETTNETLFRITAGDGNFYGDADGFVFTFDDETYTDDGDEVICRFSAFVPVIQTEAHRRVALECAMGVGTATGQGSNPAVEMRFSDDMIGNFTPWDATTLGVQGDYSARADWWQKGIAVRPGRLYEFQRSDPVNFVIHDVLVNPPR